MTEPHVDIKEDNIFALSPELLKTLLKGYTLNTNECQVNIFWATDSYVNRGDAMYNLTSDEITFIESMIKPM